MAPNIYDILTSSFLKRSLYIYFQAYTGDLGKKMKDTYAEFYKTGKFKEEDQSSKKIVVFHSYFLENSEKVLNFTKTILISFSNNLEL